MKSKEIFQLLQDAKLDIPADLLAEITINEEIPYINGVGGEDAWYNILIPTSINDIDITPAAILHDWRFYTGDNLGDFLTANRQFLNDIIFIIDSNCMTNDLSLKSVRKSHKGVWKFYSAVDMYGLNFFVTEKNTKVVGEDLANRAAHMKEQMIYDKSMGEGDMY